MFSIQLINLFYFSGSKKKKTTSVTDMDRKETKQRKFSREQNFNLLYMYKSCQYSITVCMCMYWSVCIDWLSVFLTRSFGQASPKGQLP